MNPITKHSLVLYFKKHVGPVFCKPTRDLLHRYPKMAGMFGMIIPFTKDSQHLIEVDWSLDKDFEAVGDLYPNIKNPSTAFTIEEIEAIRPGTDIPQEIDNRYTSHSWKPKNRGDYVAISDVVLNKCGHVSQKTAYASLEHIVGVVTDKCEGAFNQVMVTFVENNRSRIINVSTALLMKLPVKFKPQGCKEIVMEKSKFKVCDIVQISLAISDEKFSGLIGIVDKVILDPKAVSQYNAYTYKVCLDTLPNRNLSLTDGECGEDDIKLNEVITVREAHLNEWDEKISDKAYLALYRTHYKRSRVWVPSRNELGEVSVKNHPKKSLGTGMTLNVKILKDKKDIVISCRDIDYNWDPDVLSSALSSGVTMLGVEEDKRNPNEIESKVYIYLFDSMGDVGKMVKYRILLGTINRRKSLMKKFTTALMESKLKHPWQIHRYLLPKSLGHFYQVFEAYGYITSVGHFENMK